MNRLALWCLYVGLCEYGGRAIRRQDDVVENLRRGLRCVNEAPRGTGSPVNLTCKSLEWVISYSNPQTVSCASTNFVLFAQRVLREGWNKGFPTSMDRRATSGPFVFWNAI